MASLDIDNNDNNNINNNYNNHYDNKTYHIRNEKHKIHHNCEKSEKAVGVDAQAAILKELRAMEGATG